MGGCAPYIKVPLINRCLPSNASFQELFGGYDQQRCATSEAMASAVWREVSSIRCYSLIIIPLHFVCVCLCVCRVFFTMGLKYNYEILLFCKFDNYL